MLNAKIGEIRDVHGRKCIVTKQGLPGHAVYGPYELRDQGRYSVQFDLGISGESKKDGRLISARVDVASDGGKSILATRDVPLSELQGSDVQIALMFSIPETKSLEYRVFTTGIVPLRIFGYCRVTPIPPTATDIAALVEADQFPDAQAVANTPFLRENGVTLRRLYELGCGIKVAEGDVIISISGIAINARCRDDLRFINEIFFRNTYNFLVQKKACVIDIGMNIGLTSLFVASKQEVDEVHSFEPFKATYDRALANFRLNPELAKKIHPRNFGLSDKDEERTISIADESDSGAFSIFGSSKGSPMSIAVRNATEILEPIVLSARERGLHIIAKVDCEGSEFPIFESLRSSNMFRYISAFMVEWHGRHRSHQPLLGPLLENDFIVFDLTQQKGNGFFYAVKTGEPTKSSAKARKIGRHAGARA